MLIFSFGKGGERLHVWIVWSISVKLDWNTQTSEINCYRFVGLRNHGEETSSISALNMESVTINAYLIRLHCSLCGTMPCDAWAVGKAVVCSNRSGGRWGWLAPVLPGLPVTSAYFVLVTMTWKTSLSQLTLISSICLAVTFLFFKVVLHKL